MSNHEWDTAPHTITNDEWADMQARIRSIEKQTTEIHEFIQLLSGALNNPMVRAMIPANMRGQLGG